MLLKTILASAAPKNEEISKRNQAMGVCQHRGTPTKIAVGVHGVWSFLFQATPKRVLKQIQHPQKEPGNPHLWQSAQPSTPSSEPEEPAAQMKGRTSSKRPSLVGRKTRCVAPKKKERALKMQPLEGARPHTFEGCLFWGWLKRISLEASDSYFDSAPNEACGWLVGSGAIDRFGSENGPETIGFPWAEKTSAAY